MGRNTSYWNVFWKEKLLGVLFLMYISDTAEGINSDPSAFAGGTSLIKPLQDLTDMQSD